METSKIRRLRRIEGATRRENEKYARLGMRNKRQRKGNQKIVWQKLEVQSSSTEQEHSQKREHCVISSPFLRLGLITSFVCYSCDQAR